MLRLFFVKLLRMTGKRYDPDPDLPAAFMVHTLVERSVGLARGVLRLRAGAFLASGVRLRGKSGLSLGRFATIERGCSIDGHARRGVSIGPRTRVGAFSVVSCTSHPSKLGEGLRIGRDSAIGEFSYLGAAGGIDIGDDVIMGQYVSFHSEDHRFDEDDRPIREQGVTSRGICLGDDIWVGAGVRFLDGAEVGSHSVVAAGAVVRDRFPAHSLIGGVPARLLRATGSI